MKPASLKENVALKFKVDLAYVKEHTHPFADNLCNNIFTDAIVSTLTTLAEEIQSTLWS